jgi:hypothetical protein
MTLAPLSFQQEELVTRMRALPAYAPTLDLLHLFALEGQVDVPGLAAAIGDLAQRHAALRTSLHVDGDRVHQQVRPAALPVPVCAAPAVESAVAMLESARYDAGQVFAGQPLFRPSLHVAGDTVVLSFAIHHLLHDGWSYLILWRDLSEHYAARREGRPAQLPPLTRSYAEFAAAQRRTWTALRPAAVSYWRQAAAPCLRAKDWPEPPPAPDTSHVRETVEIALDRAEAAIVREAARSARVPPFLVLLSATTRAVFRVTGGNDLLVGSNSANREDPHNYNVVGCFTNTRLTYAQASRSKPFHELLRSVREQWLHADEHFREVYVAPLLQELGEPPLLKISMLDLPGLAGRGAARSFTGAPELAGVRVRRIPIAPRLIQWREFECTWLAGADGFRAEIAYRPPFDAATAAAIAGGIGASVREAKG